MRNSWLCVDANLVVRLVASPDDELVQRLWEGWDSEKRRLVAPTLLYYEVTNALYCYQKHDLMSAPAVRLALKAVLSLPLELYGEVALHEQALNLAERYSLPAAYDAHYLALAEWLGAEFWTADRRLAHAVKGTLPWVHLVET